MDNFALLGTCFVLGVLLRRLRTVPENAATTVNAVIINMSLPAAALLHVHSLEISLRFVPPVLMGWIVFFVGFGVFAALGRVLGWDKRTVACLTLTAALGNTSFVGLPMIEAFYGPEWMGTGLIIDQGGSFLTLCLVGIALAAAAAGAKVSPGATLRRVAAFPPFFAVIAALLLIPLRYPEWLNSVLGSLAGTLSPLALLSVGLTVRFKAVQGRLPELLWGLGYKMLLAPVIILGLYMGLLDLSGTLIKVTVFEAAMPPMVMGAIISTQYDLDPDLAGVLLGVGIPLSFATLAGWYWVLELF